MHQGGIFPGQPPEAHSPASAYFALEDLLSPAYFLSPPPAQGVRLVIEGRDGIRTTWEMSELRAQWLHSVLQGRPVRVMSVATY
ncbi:MAG TPA: hypothetical protein VK611_21635 [Acidimicrobiales bacterium]|nr:hypothetical protein [Acidimicrobiales bacterium]